jgi:hypothetical protein
MIFPSSRCWKIPHAGFLRVFPQVWEDCGFSAGKPAGTGYRGTEFPILRYSLSHTPRDQENGHCSHPNLSLTVSP